jgi:hypothetical protein
MAIALLPNPVPQFCDADGHPYAGGSIATYVPGTSTPKATWLDPYEVALNTNPIILDAAGRCVMYGDGEYQLLLRDAAGNIIWDTLSSTLVSAAMAPVVIAPTIADAVHLLGIDDMIAQEATDRAAADSAEQLARIAADNALGVRIDNETARATAAEANLQGQIDGLPAPPEAVTTVQAGSATADSGGHVRITFPTPFSVVCTAVVCTLTGGGLISDTFNVTFDRNGADVWCTEAGTPIGKPDGFCWVAVGR